MASYTEDALGNLTLIIPDSTAGVGGDPPDPYGDSMAVTLIYDPINNTIGFSDGTTWHTITDVIGGGSGGVTSFNTRTGVVTLQAGDVTALLPTASAGTKGVIRIGSGFTIDGDGIVSVTGGGGEAGVASFNTRTGAVILTEADVTAVWPKATTTTLGVVKIKDGLAINVDGELSVVGIGSTNSVDTMSELLSASTSVNVTLLGYHSKNDGGGGDFYYDVDAQRSTHNGGTIIDPTRTFPSDWSNETQKATWYAASTGTGCWIRTGDTNSVDGRIFGIKTDEVSDNTIALNAANKKGTLVGRTVYLPGGTYKVSGVIYWYTGSKLLCLGGAIKLLTDKDWLVHIEFSGDCRDIEFHGILESNRNVTTAAYDPGWNGLLHMDDQSGILHDCNFAGMEFIAPTTPINGVSFVTSHTGAGANAWIKDISFKGCKYNVGNLGNEFLNQNSLLAISSITLNGSNEVVITIAAYADIKIREGVTVLLTKIVGTGGIATLNKRFFQATAITSTTFKLKYADGSILTSSGTYTSGGYIQVYTIERIDYSNSVINFVGLPPNGYPIGISQSGFTLNCNFDNITGYDASTCIIELADGPSKVSVDNLHAYNCTGDLIQASLTNYVIYCTGNTISSIKSVGESVSTKGLLINNQDRLAFIDNNLFLEQPAIFNNLTNSLISRNNITSKTNQCIRISAYDNNGNESKNNLVFDNVFDNSLSGEQYSPIAIAGTYSHHNICDRNTFTTAVALEAPIHEYDSTTNNKCLDWRYNTTVGWEEDTSALVTTLGLVSTFGGESNSDIRKVVKRSFFGTGLTFVIEALNTNGGQPLGAFEVTYSGRKDNRGVGGKIWIEFGTYSAPTEVPKFSYTGSGEDLVYSGTATLVAGTVTVTGGLNNSTSHIALLGLTPGGTPGALFVDSKVDNTNFAVKSTSATDTSTFYYEIRNPTVKPTLTYSGTNGSGKNYWTLLFNDTTEIDVLIACNVAPAAQSSFSIGSV